MPMPKTLIRETQEEGGCCSVALLGKSGHQKRGEGGEW